MAASHHHAGHVAGRRRLRNAPMNWIVFRRPGRWVIATAATVSRRAVLLSVAAALAPAIAGAQTEAADRPSAMVETYRDWVVRCDTAAAGERRCEMAQELRQADRRLVFAALVSRTGDGDARMVFVAPFGLSLSDGLGLGKEGLDLETIAFTTCYATGCVAEATVQAAAPASLLEGESFGVSMTALGGDPVELTVSLAGFDGAWRRLQALVD